MAAARADIEGSLEVESRELSEGSGSLELG
jgi:hypothetical protein